MSAPPTRHPPNLVFVFPDQMRAQAQGHMRMDPVETPRLDAFARESLVLTQAVSNYPVCSPYRATLMTGQVPHHHGVTGNCTSRTAPHGCELDSAARCWSDLLHERGYSLGWIGKWHLDSPHEPYIACENNAGATKWNEWCPPERRHGFDFWYSYGTYDYHLRPMYWRTDAPRDGFHFVDQWGPEHEADQAIAYIENRDGSHRDPDAPFALVVSMNPPHTPYSDVPVRYRQRYLQTDVEHLLTRPSIPPKGTRWGDHARAVIRSYFAAVTGVDDQFGRILDCLEKCGHAENTIVVFTSDHGDCLGENGCETKNVPFEPSMRVPFMIRWPGQIKPRRDDLLFSAWDIYPTLLELLGYASAIPEEMDGVSHAPLFLTGRGPRPSSQPYYHMHPEAPAYGSRGVRTPQFTLVLRRDPHARDGKIQRSLYNRQDDPYQLRDIAADHPVLCEMLTATELYPWLERTGDPWLEV